MRLGPQRLRLHLGTTHVDVVVRQLADGGLLVQADGSSHVVHSEEEALGTRLTIGSQTCLLSNEHDPSQMLAISTGGCALQCCLPARFLLPLPLAALQCR